MKIKTLLDAYDKANIVVSDADMAFNPTLIDFYDKRVRQRKAFRSRILARDAEKDHLLNEWERIIGGTSAGDVFHDNVREFKK